MKSRLWRKSLLVAGIVIGACSYYIYWSRPASSPTDAAPLAITLRSAAEVPVAASISPETAEGAATEARSLDENGGESGSALLPIAAIPGGELITHYVKIREAPLGAGGLSELYVDERLTDEERARRLARAALNSREEPEVRNEAFEQWLKLLPEEAQALFVPLAQDARLSPEMAALLLKDTFSRAEPLQAHVALTLLAQANETVRQLAREHLQLLTGKNHADDLAWKMEIQSKFGLP